MYNQRVKLQTSCQWKRTFFWQTRVLIVLSIAAHFPDSKHRLPHSMSACVCCQTTSDVHNIWSESLRTYISQYTKSKQPKMKVFSAEKAFSKTMIMSPGVKASACCVPCSCQQWHTTSRNQHSKLSASSAILQKSSLQHRLVLVLPDLAQDLGAFNGHQAW